MVINRFAGTLVLGLALLAVPAAAFAAAVPSRIITLSPTATEDLFAIGAGKQVIAVDSQSNYPANAPHTKLSAYTPNAEAIAGYKPDLVVISNDLGGIVRALHTLHIKVMMEPAASTLSDTYGQIAQLGKVTGHASSAAALVTRMRAEIASIAASVPHPATPITVYHELDKTLYSATSKTFIGRIYTLLGLKDIADAATSGNGYPQLSSEYIVSANPSLIVLADSIYGAQTAAKVAKRPGWQTVTAIAKGHVLAVSDDIASRWGPRIVDFMRQVAATVKAVAAS